MTGIHAPACLKLCRSHRFGAPGTPVQSPGTFQLKSVHQDSAGVASRRRLRAPSEPWGSKKRPRRAKFKAVAHERTHHGCGLAGVDGASPDAGPEVSHIRLAKTLAAIDSLGRHLSGIPGRKNLVWIGAGISISSVTGALGTGPHGSIETFEDKVKRTRRSSPSRASSSTSSTRRGSRLPDRRARSRPAPCRCGAAAASRRSRTASVSATTRSRRWT